MLRKRVETFGNRYKDDEANIRKSFTLEQCLVPRVRSCEEAEVDGLETKIKDRIKTVDNISRYPPVTVAIAILAAPPPPQYLRLRLWREVAGCLLLPDPT